MTLGIPLPTRHGWGLLLPVIPLCLAGILTIQVASAPEIDGGIAPAALKQLMFVCAGCVLAGVVLAIGYQRIGRLSFLLFAGCLLLLVWLVLDRWIDVPFVTRQRGAWRWIRLGPIQFQPSELMKIVYVLALAWYLRYRRNYRTMPGLIMPFVITLIPMALIKMQPDLGTVLLFLPVLFAMLFAAGAKGRHLAVIIVLGLLCLPIFWVKIEPYQRLRFAGVLLQSPDLRTYLTETNPDAWLRLKPPDTPPEQWVRRLTDWEMDTGYQLVRSKTAIGSGGVLGHGWGRGVFVDHTFLPERHNDFIFAMIGHQWGLLGVLFVLLCYAAVVLIGFDVATLTLDPFGRLVAVGLSTLLAVQTLTNMAMTIGLGPITGLTLPFVSAGGSSLMASFICLALLISVAQRRPILIGHRPFEFNEEAERYQFA